MPVVLMLCGGGRTLEDIRKIQQDVGLRRPRPLPDCRQIPRVFTGVMPNFHPGHFWY
ncbi:MAG: hypothetical protein ABIL25_02950 [candidate division WOR-3 bacterium]